MVNWFRLLFKIKIGLSIAYYGQFLKAYMEGNRVEGKVCKLMPTVQHQNNSIKEWLEIFPLSVQKPLGTGEAGKEQSLSVLHLPGQRTRIHFYWENWGIWAYFQQLQQSGICSITQVSQRQLAAERKQMQKKCPLKRSLHRNSQRQNTTGRFKCAPCPLNHQPPYWGSKNSSAFGNVNPILVMFNFTSCVFVSLEEVKLMHCMFVLFPLIADLQTMSAVVWSDKSCLQDTDSPGD